MKGIFGKITHEVTSPTVHTVTPVVKEETVSPVADNVQPEQNNEQEQDSGSTESIGLSGEEDSGDESEEET